MSVIAQRKLTIVLRQIRRNRDLTQTQVAADMEWSLSKLIRIENGAVKVSVSDLRSLLAYYGVQDGVDNLLALARAAKGAAGWWKTFVGRVPDPIVNLAAHEAEATSIWSFEPLVVPGVLQTKAYATTVSFAQVDVEFRLRRRAELLARAPELTFVIDESVLHRTPSGRKLMAEQVDSIIEDIQRPNVSVRILPYTAGAHRGWAGGYTIINCGGQRLLVTSNGFQASEDTTEIDTFEGAFEELLSHCLTANESEGELTEALIALRK